MLHFDPCMPTSQTISLESLSLPPGCYAYEEPTTGLTHCRGKDSFAGILEPTAWMLCCAKVQLRMSRRAYRLWNQGAQKAKAKEKHEHAKTCVFRHETLISGYPGLFSLVFENHMFSRFSLFDCDFQYKNVILMHTKNRGRKGQKHAISGGISGPKCDRVAQNGRSYPEKAVSRLLILPKNKPGYRIWPLRGGWGGTRCLDCSSSPAFSCHSLRDRSLPLASLTGSPLARLRFTRPCVFLDAPVLVLVRARCGPYSCLGE